MTQQDTKIPTFVAVPNEKCDGCCFRPDRYLEMLGFYATLSNVSLMNAPI